MGDLVRRNHRRAAALLAALGLAVVLWPGLPADAGNGQVHLVDLEGPVGPASVDFVERAITEAETVDAEAIVIRMDTPGGLDKSMRHLVKHILAADVPVITFVAPNGARAASAGTYIAFASHVAAMAPATNIGSSTPVSIGGPPAPADDNGEDDSSDRSTTPLDPMTRKVVNDAVAYLQGLAELRGRNVEWAEETVRDGANLRSSEALSIGVVDLVADNVDALLEALDGREVVLPARTVTLATAGATLVVAERDWRAELLEVLTDPTVAYALLVFGIYALILEFYAPGMVFPAVAGVIMLLLGAYGLQMLPVNYVGLALIAVGIAMMVFEAFAPSFGVLAVGGVVAFVAGSLLLIDSDMPEYQVPLGLVGGFAIATVIACIVIVGGAIRARNARVVTGKRALIGATAVAEHPFTDGEGSVQVAGEHWHARSDQPIAAGEAVCVLDVDGLTLVVVPAAGAVEDAPAR